MNAIEIIERKRDGETLSAAEIDFFVSSYVAGELPDYQAAAWLMAVLLQGMDADETLALTLAMSRSGEVMDLSRETGFAVDKHSSGGVGDKTTLIALPLVAACGVPAAKMSGRGLSLFGGTIDKLESIDGFRTDLTSSEFREQARMHGIVLSGQSADLAPADGLFYALRDVTGTVPSKPLIASSIMSKKIAAGAQGVVLDVKYGRGAFMPTLDDARELAHIMVSIGQGAGRRVTALLSDMNQPLGHAVGNALEVREAIETLGGDGPPDLTEHCLQVAGHMLRLAGRCSADDLSDARPLLEGALADGSALATLRKLVELQGGDTSQIDRPDTLPRAPFIEPVNSPRDGYLASVDALRVAHACLELGAGRKTKSEPIDPAVGVVLSHQVGERVAQGETLFTVHAARDEDLPPARDEVLAAFEWSETETRPPRPEVVLG
jgi:pyrimidine-nucleoside phosphorylase